MKDLGYGRDYRYAHDEADAYAAGENYFPDGIPQRRFYEPTERGLEAKIRARLQELRELDDAARRKK
jgi:putative ATPase